ncbi:MAG TPA: ABC transporter permease subunit, partial [Pseudonocardiaceae bacterium]|nr:ABC transporter permease subunit [Pseudonocardiaceae bacterium]
QDLGIDISTSGWLFTLTGLTLVYTYFQVPLMVIVFLPALDGIRPQWREAADTLGATTWQYWRHVGLPLLFPSFLGCTLLLFANAFAAYATAAALVAQGAPILPLQIRDGLQSEIRFGYENVAYSIALEMVLIVAIVMYAYYRLQRRTSGWLR